MALEHILRLDNQWAFAHLYQIGMIKLVTKLEGTAESLENLGKLYRTFSVHHKHQQHESYNLTQAHRMVKTVSSYCSGTTENSKSTVGIKRLAQPTVHREPLLRKQ